LLIDQLESKKEQISNLFTSYL